MTVSFAEFINCQVMRKKVNVNWHVYGRERLRHILRYHPSIYLEELQKATTNPIKDSLCPGLYSNRSSVQYASEGLHFEPFFSVR